ncbi:MAG: hypothetical protein ACRBC3_16760 [Burkholderiaceae bacterium]
MKRLISTVGGIALVGLVWLNSQAALSAEVTGADPQRGRMLYETQCTQCHNSVLHLRDPRLAQTFDEVRIQVRRWSKAAGVEWGQEEVEDVTDYLNAVFYRYPCPDGACSFSPQLSPDRAATELSEEKS